MFALAQFLSLNRHPSHAFAGTGFDRKLRL
jgi:hypothetical protein